MSAEHACTRGQVSLEIVLLASVIIMMSMGVFGYYMQIRQTTLAIELLRIEALKEIDKKDMRLVIGQINYVLKDEDKDNVDELYMCIETIPREDIWEETRKQDVADFIEEKTGLGNVVIYDRINPCRG